MMLISSDQSHESMERKFAALKTYDIIELCYENKKFPAIVYTVNHSERNFTILKLDKSVVKDLCKGFGLGFTNVESIVVEIPSKPQKVHPNWNLIGY